MDETFSGRYIHGWSCRVDVVQYNLFSTLKQAGSLINIGLAFSTSQNHTTPKTPRRPGEALSPTTTLYYNFSPQSTLRFSLKNPYHLNSKIWGAKPETRLSTSTSSRVFSRSTGQSSLSLSTMSAPSRCTRSVSPSVVRVLS